MEKITYDNIHDTLVEKFPEYRQSEKYYEEINKDLPYVVLGNLSLMAFENLDKKRDISLAEKLVTFTDEIFNDPKSNDELINLFAIQVLEVLIDSRMGALLSKRLLHGKSLELIEQTLKGFRSDAFLDEYRKK